VGHAGSGTTVIAEALEEVLAENKIEGSSFEVEPLKARDVIKEWAVRKGEKLPPERASGHFLEDVKRFQDLGDMMRAEKAGNGEPDHAAVARGLIAKIRKTRAEKLKVEIRPGKPVVPDGRPRAYILDALRHPAEVNLLRSVYRDAFILIGVVCEEEKRVARIANKYNDGGRMNALLFMERDSGDTHPHGQQVAKAFHLSDYFVDNLAFRESQLHRTGSRTHQGRRRDMDTKTFRGFQVISGGESQRKEGGTDTVGLQQHLFPFRSRRLLVFVSFASVTDTEFLSTLESIGSATILDLRRAPRFDIGKLSRQVVFGLFRRLGSTYMDLTVGAEEERDRILLEDRLKKALVAYEEQKRPFIFLVGRVENHPELSGEVVKFFNRSDEKWEIFQVPPEPHAVAQSANS
jgi:hypothetical protein